VSVVIDVHELPGRRDETVDVARAERRDHGRLSRATLDMLLCDSDLSRIVMAGASEVLDVGRATRTCTPAQWKALVARDRHCRHPGCKMPPERCDAHHVQYWEHGGNTDLANLVLLCRHHHRQRHRAEARARSRPHQEIAEPRLAPVTPMPRVKNERAPVP
jgi:hypothetical protein